MANDFAPDYNDVPSRIRQFREKHPEGSLRPVDISRPYSIETLGGETYIVYCAAAFRSADDMLPGVGTAWEPVPGKTPFTRGSEIQNAETSAWGRAIVASLAADAKRIASDEEIHSARQAQELPPLATEREVSDVIDALKARGDGYPEAWKAANLPTLSVLRGVLAGDYYLTKEQHGEMVAVLEHSGPVEVTTSVPSTPDAPGPESSAAGPRHAAAPESDQQPRPVAPDSGAPSFWNPGEASLRKAVARCAALAAIGVDIGKERRQKRLPELRVKDCKLRDEVEWHEWMRLLEQLEIAADRDAERAGAAT